jgi:hypothetical protein
MKLVQLLELDDSNQPLLARQVRATFASDSRIRRESGAYATQMVRAKFVYDVRHVARVHVYTSCTCRATRDVTFGLCSRDCHTEVT